MSDALAWTVERLTRDEDLPGALVSEKPQNKPRGPGVAIRAVLDKTWRSRPELARLAGCDETTVGRVMSHLVQTGEAEKIDAKFPRPAQFRRAR